MILCKNGHQNPDGATTCAVCGIDITPMPVKPPLPSPAPPLVTLSETSLRTAVDNEVASQIRIDNVGGVTDEFEITLLGEAAAFGSVEPSSLAIEPAASGVAQVTFRPPASASGALAFEARVTSQQLPAEPVSTLGLVEITAPSEEEEEDTTAGDGAAGPTEHRALAALAVVGLVGVALLVLGIAFPWDNHEPAGGDPLAVATGRSWLAAHFHPSAGTISDVLHALSAIAVAVGVLVALLLARRAERRPFAAGLLIGFGVAGALKYAGVLGRVVSWNPTQRGSVLVFVLVTVAACGIVAVGVGLLRTSETGPRDGAADSPLPVQAAIFGAAVLIIAGSVVPFNGGGGGNGSKAVVTGGVAGWHAIDPLGVALAALGVALVIGSLSRAAAAGVLIALGIESVALWPRYIGVPLVESRDVASPAAGGFIGLAGGILLLLAGCWLLLHARAEPTRAAASESHS